MGVLRRERAPTWAGLDKIVVVCQSGDESIYRSLFKDPVPEGESHRRRHRCTHTHTHCIPQVPYACAYAGANANKSEAT